MKIHTRWYKAYDHAVSLIVCEREELPKAKLANYDRQLSFNKRVRVPEATTLGMYCGKVTPYFSFMWLPPNAAVTTLVHECVHAAHSILLSHGIRLTNETTEAYAYFIDQLIQDFFPHM